MNVAFAAAHQRLICASVLAAALVAPIGRAAPAADRTSDMPAPSGPDGPRRAEPPLLDRLQLEAFGIEDPLPPFRPVEPIDETQRDRTEALIRFATARTLERRGEYAPALRLYQRAFRGDPGSVAIAEAVVRLAARLGRLDEAARYALKADGWTDADPLLLRRLAVRLLLTGDLAGAARLYERILSARASESPTAVDVALWREAGEAFCEIDDYRRAAEMFARVLEALKRPDQYGLDQEGRQRLLGAPAAAYNRFGECLLRAGRPDEALAAFEKAHQAAPDEGGFQLRLARVYAQTGRPGEALAAVGECLAQKADRSNPAAWRLLADLLREQGRKDEWTARLERFHAENPDDPLVGCLLAAEYVRGGQSGQAESLLCAISETVEKSGSTGALDDVAYRLSDDAEAARNLVAVGLKLAERQPEKLGPAVRKALALMAVRDRQFEAADVLAGPLIGSKPDEAAGLVEMWGVGLLVADRPAEAEELFRRAIAGRPPDDEEPAFWFYLAGALAVEEKNDEALAAARKAAEASPDSARFQSRVAWLLYRGKRYGEAADTYRALIERFDVDYEPGAERDLLRDARLALSSLCVIRHEMPQAEEWLEQVLDEFPDDVGAMNDLGYLWADRGEHLHRALGMIERAVAAEPDNPAYRDSLGWVYYRLGRFQQAVAALEMAASARPDPEVLDHLGAAYRQIGQPAWAKDAWQRAAEAFMEQGEQEKAKAARDKIRLLDP